MPHKIKFTHGTATLFPNALYLALLLAPGMPVQ